MSDEVDQARRGLAYRCRIRGDVPAHAAHDVHNLQVQVMNTAGLVVIDDWKMKVVVYD